MAQLNGMFRPALTFYRNRFHVLHKLQLAYSAATSRDTDSPRIPTPGKFCKIDSMNNTISPQVERAPDTVYYVQFPMLLSCWMATDHSAHHHVS